MPIGSAPSKPSHPDTDADIFRRLFMALPIGAALLGPDMSFSQANTEMLRLIGREEKALAGLALADILHPDLDPPLAEESASHPHGLGPEGRKAWLSTASGDPVRVRLRLAEIPGRQPGAELRVCLAEALDGRERMKQSLQESRQLLEKTFTGLHDAVFIVGAEDTRILRTNPAATAIFGYSEQEMVGRTTEFLHVDKNSLERFRDHLRCAMVEQGRLFLPEFSMRRKNGEIFPTEHRVMPIEDDKGRLAAWVSLVRDASTSVADRNALRESMNLLRGIIDQSDIAILIRDREGRHALANKRACQMMERSMAAVVGKTVWEIFPSELADRFHREDLEVMRTGRPLAFEEDEVWRGERIILHKAKFPLHDATGQVRAVGTVITDHTRRKLAEEELQKAHDELEDQVRERTRELERANLELTNEIRARKWAEEELLRRDKLLEAAGICSRLLLTYSDFDHALLESLATLGRAANVDRVYMYERTRGAEPVDYGFSLRLQWRSTRVEPRADDLVEKDGKWRKRVQALAQGRPIHGRLADFMGQDRERMAMANVRSIMLMPIHIRNRFWGFLGLEDCRDERVWRDSETTALAAAAGIFGGALVRHRTEQELVSSEALVRAVVDSAVEGILTVKGTGEVATINPAAEHVFRRGGHDILGRKFTDLLGPDWREIGLKALASPQRHKNPLEMEGVDGAGNLFPLELAVSSFVIQGRTMYTCQVRDITERKKMERLKREFLSVVSHELRTPLTSINGAIGLMIAGQAGHLGEQARSLLDIAAQNSRRLLLLIEDILDIQKIEAGKAVFDFQPVDLCELVRRSAKEMMPEAQAGLPPLVTAVEAEELPVRADPHRLTQVVDNLLSNAFKFSPPDKPVAVAAKRGGMGARVEVRDQGPGVPDHFKDRIFERFAQADATDTRGRGGTGLGLSIAREIVLRHGGRIGFENQPEGGAIFYFELPLDEKTGRED